MLSVYAKMSQRFLLNQPTRTLAAGLSTPMLFKIVAPSLVTCTPALWGPIDTSTLSWTGVEGRGGREKWRNYIAKAKMTICSIQPYFIERLGNT